MKINLPSLTLALFLSTFALSATAETGSAQNGSSATSSNLTAAQKEDGNIIEMLIAINTNEINAGNEALKRTSNPDVKNFAQDMVTAHGQNLQAFEALSKKINIVPIDSSMSEKVIANGKKELETLSSVADNKFDMTYANAMVKGHQAVLNVIDKKLLPNVSNPDLKTLLTATRTAVTQHLQMAQTLQKQLAQN